MTKSSDELQQLTDCKEIEDAISRLSGKWTGSISGTNAGLCIINIGADERRLKGTVQVDDKELGSSIYEFVGDAKKNGFELELSPSSSSDDVELSTTRVVGIIQIDGALSGIWESENGTRGAFQASKDSSLAPPVDTSSQPMQPMTAITHEKIKRVPPCIVDIEILKRIYKNLSTGSDEAARLEVANRQPNNLSLTTDDTAKIRELYSVVIIAKGSDGERVVSLDSSLLEESNLPKPLHSIEFQIGSFYKLRSGVDAPNQALVKLDFTKPAVLDFYNPSDGPTPNESIVEIKGSDSMWVSGILEKTLSTLQIGRVHTNWLHSQRTYDALLALLGLPGSLSTAAITVERIGNKFSQSSVFSRLALFLFILYASLAIFRLGFNAARWLLPLVEHSNLNQPLHRQFRIILSALIIGVLGSLAASALWEVFKLP